MDKEEKLSALSNIGSLLNEIEEGSSEEVKELLHKAMDSVVDVEMEITYKD